MDEETVVPLLLPAVVYNQFSPHQVGCKTQSCKNNSIVFLFVFFLTSIHVGVGLVEEEACCLLICPAYCANCKEEEV